MAEQIQLAEFDLDMQGVIQEAQKYKKIIDDLKDAQKQLRKEGKQSSEQYVQNEANIKTLNKEYRERIKVLDQANEEVIRQQNATQKLEDALSNEATTIAGLRASNKELNKIRNNTNIETEEGRRQLQQLNEKLDENNKKIKENADAYTQQKINIGNYTESVLDAYNALEKQKQELEQNEQELKQARDETEKGSKEWKAYSQALVKVEQDLNGVEQEMNQTNEETSESIELTEVAGGGFFGLATAAEEAGGAGALMATTFASAKAAIVSATKAAIRFIATPIGAVVAAVAGAVLLVANAMSRSEESTNKLQTALAPLMGIFNSLLDALKPVGDFLLDVLIVALDSAVKGVNAAILGLAKAMEVLGFDEAAASTRDFAEGMKEAAEAGRELTAAEEKLQEMERQAEVTQLRAERKAEELRRARDDESKSIQERMEANQQLGEVLEQQRKDELAIARQALLVAQKTIQVEGDSTANLDARAAANARIEEIKGRITEQTAEQVQNENALREEAQAAAEEAANARIAQAQSELDLFIAEQGFRKKSAEEELNLAREVSAEKIAILKSQYENEQITLTEFQAQRKTLQNELALQEAEAAAANAEMELEAYRKNIERKLGQDKYLSQQVFKNRVDLNNRLLNEEKEFQKLKLEQGLINQAEYDAAIQELENETRIANEELAAERNATKREEELALRALRFEEDLEIMRQEGATRFEVQQEQARQQAAQELTALQKQFNDKLISERVYAAKKERIVQNREDAIADIQEAKRRAELSAAAATLGAVSQIVDENSAAGKAIAVAQALINTYQGITAGVALGYPAAIPAVAAAAATGFAAVSDILSTEIPSASGSGSVSGEGGATAAPTYSSGFRISGMDENLSGSANATVQSQLEANGLINEMSNQVGQAVEEGSRRGSSEGITNLSDNRDIQNSSAF